jgi:hypothetical protein
VTAETEAKERETLRLKRKMPELSALLREVAQREALDEEGLRKLRRAREIVTVTKLFCQLAVRKYRHSGSSVARFLGVTTSLVNRYVASGDFFELRRDT